MARIQIMALPTVNANGSAYTPFVFVIDQAGSGNILPDATARAQFLQESGAKSVVVFADTVDVAQ